MARLSSIFRAAGGDECGADDEGLERRLAELWVRGRAAHPQIVLDDEAFAAHLGRCGAAAGDALQEVHAEDLYLTCACLAGDSVAVARLRDDYGPVVARYVKRVGRTAAILEEVQQQLWNAMFVGGDDGPRLASFAGRGPLGGWVGISAQRIALMMLRHERAENRARNELAACNELAAADPEIAAIRERYRPQFQAAVDAAIAALDDRDKMLYRMHLVEGLTLERIAKAYGVSHPTIIRWFKAARGRVLDEAKRRLREALPVSSGEFESIARLLISQLDLDISQALEKTA